MLKLQYCTHYRQVESTAASPPTVQSAFIADVKRCCTLKLGSLSVTEFIHRCDLDVVVQHCIVVRRPML